MGKGRWALGLKMRRNQGLIPAPVPCYMVVQTQVHAHQRLPKEIDGPAS